MLARGYHSYGWVISWSEILTELSGNCLFITLDVKFGPQIMKMGRLAPISFILLIILNIIECKSNEGKFVIKKIQKLLIYKRVSHDMQHVLVFRNSRLNF